MGLKVYQDGVKPINFLERWSAVASVIEANISGQSMVQGRTFSQLIDHCVT